MVTCHPNTYHQPHPDGADFRTTSTGGDLAVIPTHLKNSVSVELLSLKTKQQICLVVLFLLSCVCLRAWWLW